MRWIEATEIPIEGPAVDEVDVDACGLPSDAKLPHEGLAGGHESLNRFEQERAESVRAMHGVQRTAPFVALQLPELLPAGQGAWELAGIAHFPKLDLAFIEAA